MLKKDLEYQNTNRVTWLLITPHHTEPFWVEIIVKNAEKMVPWADIIKFINLYLINKHMRNELNAKPTKGRK